MDNEHRKMYPSQYTHPLCGKPVVVTTHTGFALRGTVTRVVPSMFGRLAILDSTAIAYSVKNCKPINKE